MAGCYPAFMRRNVLALTLLLLGSCAREPEPPREVAPDTAAPDVATPGAEATSAQADSSASTAQRPFPPVSPPAPGTPGGLPDDRTPISEAPFTPTSAQGAANVVQIYYALLGEHRYNDAWKLWTQSGQGSGMTADAFVSSFAQYESYNANIGAPGQIEGAAGSLFVSVPVVIYGRRTSGEEVHEIGEATLRRVNDVPGSTPEQRAWHLFKIDLKLSPGPGQRTD
jgi:hypothetical protein